MAYFKKEYLDFFEDLEKNNEREWFQENKKRYEEYVKTPFSSFVNDLILSFHDIFPEMTMTSKEAIFRIYRDVRFSKDKKPYKNHLI